MMAHYYYLIADPVSGLVRRRAHTAGRVHLAAEPHLHALRVEKRVWKHYRAGDVLRALDLEEGWQRNFWLASMAREAAAQRRKESP